MSKYILIFYVFILSTIQLFGQSPLQTTTIKPESNEADNVIYSEYVNPNFESEPPIFQAYHPSGGGSYNPMINKIKEFNKSYDPENFALYVFHGQYYVDVEKIIVPKKGIKNETLDALSSGSRLKVLQEKYKAKSQKELRNLFIQNLHQEVLQTVREKVGSEKRIIIVFAVRVHFLSYTSFKEEKKDPNNAQITTYKTVFWLDSELEASEKEIIKRVKDSRTQVFSTDLGEEGIYTYEGVNNFVGEGGLQESFLNSAETVMSSLIFNKEMKRLKDGLEDSELTTLLSKFSTHQFSLLSWQERIQILSRFSKSEMTDEWLWGLAGNDRENIAIKVLATAPQEQHSRILHYLETAEHDLLKNLIARIDGDNFASFVGFLSQYTYSYRARPSIEDNTSVANSVKNHRFLCFHDWKGLNYKVEEYGRMSFSVRESFTRNYQYKIEEANAFEYVLVYFDDNFSTAQGAYYPTGYRAFMPAIALYSLYNEADNRRIRLFVDVLGVGAGVGGVVTSQTWKAFALALLDLGVASTDIVISQGLVDDLNATQEGKEVLATWNTFAMMYGGGVMTGLVLKNGQKFYQSARSYLRKKSNPELQKIVDKLEEKESSFKNLPEEVGGTGVAGVGNLLANYPKIRAILAEIDPILKSAGFDRYRFENLIRQSDNLKYLEDNASLLTEIADKVKAKMQYTDADLLKIFKDAVNTDFVTTILPTGFVNTLKSFGKTENEIVNYFRNYHNVYTKGDFFTQIEELLLKNNIYNLTKDEAFALWGYTTNFFYKDLNKWLREGSNISKTSPIANLMRQAMQKVPKYNGTAYRALEFKGNDLITFLNKYGVKGTEVIFDDFLSCGSTKEAAFFNKAEKNVRIVMDVKDAPIISSVADGIKFRGYRPEELLLNTGRKFFISDVKSLPDGIYEIRMTQIN